MISRLTQSLLLSPTDIQSSVYDYQVIGVFNPGAIRIGDEVFLLVRVAETPVETRAGFVGLPSWDDGNRVVHWIAEEDLELPDARVVRRKSDRLLRLTSISHLRVFHQRRGEPDWVPGPMLLPDSSSEEFGIEDPRITEIDGTYWITYVAVSRHGAATALMSTNDMLTFKRHGLIFCPENKDVMLFPEKIADQYVALHRPNPNSHFSPPQIWLARSPDLLHWGQHEVLYRGQSDWEGDRVGGGTPPILIEEGWLHLYHGSQRSDRPGQVGTYSVGALLLDRDDPSLILARSSESIMVPTAEFERSGFVPDVVFPTAMIDQGETFSVYYGAADTCVGVVTFSRTELLAALH
jgi:beta-1,2-mannobiose phosphorylase / 1,2-beta-oligomannan phosphorylase